MQLPHNSVILYLAHGSDSVRAQTLFSILTLHYHAGRQPAGFTVVVYTDRPDYFSQPLGGTGIAIEPISAAQLAAWKGPYGFIHRVKTLVIQHCFAKYKQNTLYLDGDTFFLRNPTGLLAEITPTRSLMNKDEYDMHDGGEHELQHWFDLRKAIKNQQFELHGAPVTIPLATRMWNAGVMGISYANRALLDDIVSLTDQLYAGCPLFSVEQFATSYVLQHAMQVASTQDYILHYCYGGVKAAYTHHITQFLTEQAGQPLAALAEAAHKLTGSIAALPAPVVAAKPLTLLGRVLLRARLVKEVALTGGLRSNW